jgi:hypothetical protein
MARRTMTRFLSAVPALLVLIATSPIQAGQKGALARIPSNTPNTVAGVKIPETSRAFTTIQGNALDSANGQLANAVVRLRDARFGRIVDTQYTDKAGLFEFRGIDPGTYVVEILGNDQSILAASQLIIVDAGSSALALVKLPFKVPPFAVLMGTTSTRSATMLLLTAAAAGITALVPTAPISPNQ